MYKFRDITLRNVVRADMPMLFAILGDPDHFHLWGHRRVMEEAQFYDLWRSWSADRMAAKFIILKRGRPIGLVFDYERSLEDGHTKVATILANWHTGHGAGIIATLLFAKWLFETVPLRKFYMDVFEYNTQMVDLLRKRGYQEEVTRREYRFWNGKYWDCYGFAIARERVDGMLGRVFRGRPVQRVNTPFAQPQNRVDAQRLPQNADRNSRPQSNGKYRPVDEALVSWPSRQANKHV